MKHFGFTGWRVMVVGDLMLDKYLSGSVERLSPEAPVPVLLRENERGGFGQSGKCLRQPRRARGRGRRRRDPPG
jgi:D-beta-D-heptose 7-phosphate kinase/D-beta-D-heptose 1-phosphate adenosyltransferase